MVTVGIDEVGRGCWAGPLVAGAVLLDSGFEVPAGSGWRLNDSKALTRMRREAAVAGLRSMANTVTIPMGLGWVSPDEVDALGLTAAVQLAMRRALDEVRAFGVAWDEVIIDGSYNFLPDEPTARAVVKADGSVSAVSAASIVAKVARDQYMSATAAIEFPGYGFERHVGYGTMLHRQALGRLGVCRLHRRSFKPVQAFLKPTPQQS